MSRLITHPPHSIPLHSTRSLPETPPLLPSTRLIPRPPPPPNLSLILSLSPLPVSLPPNKSITSCSHHHRDTLATGRRVAHSHRSRIGRVAIYCVTLFCLLVTDFLIVYSPNPTVPLPEVGSTSSHPSVATAASR